MGDVGRRRVCFHRLLYPGGFQLAQDVGDVFVFAGEDVLGEADDGPGDARRTGQALAVADELQQKPSEAVARKECAQGSPSWSSTAVIGMTMRAAMSRSSRSTSGPMPSMTALAASMSLASSARM
ncbi:hypothetical protein [Streptomyces sp. NPDC059076]|uniref:hypothetical protein n=1 Tax=unclassified Streptomyces TaxID=2593676 RepID=UPI00367FB4BB